MNAFASWPVLAVALVVAVLAASLAIRSGGTPRREVLRRGGLALLLVVIALRPAFGDETVERGGPAVDVVFLVDRTASMAAEDYAGGQSRMDGVRADLTDLIGQLGGGRVAMVTFDNDAGIALPFTTDLQSAVSLSEVLGWREADYGQGTDIGIGAELALNLLERSLTERPEAARLLIYLGDGEQTKDTPFVSFDELRGLVDGGLVLGYGTAEGGRMRTLPGSDDYLVRDGEPAISRADMANLRTIADQLGVPFQQRTAPGDITVDIPPTRTQVSVEKVPGGFELYWIAAAMAVGILGVELWELIGKLRQAGREMREP